MRKIAIVAAVLLISAGTSVAFASASSASVCRPNGTGCTKAGTYRGPNAVINRDFLGVKVVLICGFGVRVPGGAPFLTWSFTVPGHFLCPP